MGSLKSYLLRWFRPLVFVVILLNLFKAVPAAATSFDGTYNYSYNLKGPSGWETHRVNSGFIVKNSIISSNPAALSGSVGSSGAVQFTGPCPYGDPRATFTGTINSDGQGSGTYSCPYGHTGGWAVTRVSGGDSPLDQVFLLFSSIGESFSISSDEFVNATMGMMVLSIPVIGVAALVGSQRRKRRAVNQANTKTRNTAAKVPSAQSQVSNAANISPCNIAGGHRELGYQVSEANSTQTQDGPSRIDFENGHLMEASGEVITTPQTSSLKLNATWPKGQVNLKWGKPQFDSATYRLDGYVISSMNYSQSSTDAVKTVIDQLPPYRTQWASKFEQTYKWNTRGDTEGYIVEAILRHHTGTGTVQTIKVGAMAYVPYPPAA
jgi:hypothetical protein